MIQMLGLDANDKIISACIMVPYRELELGVAMSVVSFACNGSVKTSQLHLEPFHLGHFSVAVRKHHDQTS